MKTISVPSGRWHDNTERELTFPDRWEVDNLTSPGFDKPGLSADQIREKINNPIYYHCPAGRSSGSGAVCRSEQGGAAVSSLHLYDHHAESPLAGGTGRQECGN